MSVVVAIKDGGGVWMACDSQVTCGDVSTTHQKKNSYKMFRSEKDEDLLIGVCGAVRDRDILFCIERFIDELSVLKDEVDYKYIVKKVVPLMIKEFTTNKRIDETKNETHQGMDVLFCYRDKIFAIYSDFCVMEIENWFAIGSGREFAIGYLNECDKTDLKQSAVNAVKAACSNIYVSQPILVSNTMQKEIEVIN